MAEQQKFTPSSDLMKRLRESVRPKALDLTKREASEQLAERGVRMERLPGGGTISGRGPMPSDVQIDLSGTGTMLPPSQLGRGEASVSTPDGPRFIGADQNPSEALQVPGFPEREARRDAGQPSGAGSQSGSTMGVQETQKRIAELFGTDAPSTINQAVTGNPEAVMGTDPQGRMRSFESEEARRQAFREADQSFEQASEAREARAAENFGKARKPDETDRGEGEFTMEVATRLAGGDRDKARVMIERQRQGLDPMTGQPATTAQEDVPERERRVESLMNTMGLSRREALGLVEGTTRIQSDPTTGNAVIVDMVTGDTRPIDMSPDISEESTQKTETASPPQDGGEPSRTLFEMAKESTGIFPSVKALGQRITGQVGVELGDAPEIVNMRQNVDTAQRQLIRALAINPRFPVSEQESIKKEVDIAPSAWNDPVTLESKMRAVDDALTKRLEDEIESARNKQLPRNTRQAALQAANDIGNFLELLRVPDEEGADNTQTSGDPEIDAIAQKYLQ